jgi:hypothetical protein
VSVLAIIEKEPQANPQIVMSAVAVVPVAVDCSSNCEAHGMPPVRSINAGDLSVRETCPYGRMTIKAPTGQCEYTVSSS